MKLKKVSPGQKGLAKLPTSVRNKMGYMNNGGKLKGLKKKGPSTDKIKNNKANLEAKKVMSSSMKGSANVGKNLNKGRAAGAQSRGPMDLKPMGYTPQPKPAPKPMNKKKGYVRVWDAKAGKYVNKLKYNEGGRVSRVLARGKKKAERIHEREAKKESKGKKVAVAGTKRVTTAAEPRMLTSRRKTVKVYQKERDVVNKADVKAAKIEGKQATKTPKGTKVKPPKIKKKTPRPPRGRGRRPDKPGKGGIKKVIQNIKKIVQNKKKGCFGRGDC